MKKLENSVQARSLEGSLQGSIFFRKVFSDSDSQRRNRLSALFRAVFRRDVASLVPGFASAFALSGVVDEKRHQALFSVLFVITETDDADGPSTNFLRAAKFPCPRVCDYFLLYGSSGSSCLLVDEHTPLRVDEHTPLDGERVDEHTPLDGEKGN